MGRHFGSRFVLTLCASWATAAKRLQVDVLGQFPATLVLGLATGASSKLWYTSKEVLYSRLKERLFFYPFPFSSLTCSCSSRKPTACLLIGHILLLSSLIIFPFIRASLSSELLASYRLYLRCSVLAPFVKLYRRVHFHVKHHCGILLLIDSILFIDCHLIEEESVCLL